MWLRMGACCFARARPYFLLLQCQTTCKYRIIYVYDNNNMMMKHSSTCSWRLLKEGQDNGTIRGMYFG